MGYECYLIYKEMIMYLSSIIKGVNLQDLTNEKNEKGFILFGKSYVRVRTKRGS